MKTTRRFFPNGVQHIYQRANDKGVIFYDDIDRLVYFSIDSVMARRYGITVIGSSIMFTHLHKTAIVEKKRQMSKYIQDTGSVFSRAYNCRHGREGNLFQPRFGSSSKTELKKIRHVIAYQYNNHTEKGLCKHPMEERWCFLAYAKSDHPFSKQIDYENISGKLNRALKLIDHRVGKGQYLKYSLVQSIFDDLSAEEWEQFLDYTISKYMFIDFAKASSYFGSFEAMLLAFDAISGAENDLKDDYDSFPDTDYVRIGEIFRQKGWPYRKIFQSPVDKRKILTTELHLKRGINYYAAAKYLHI